MNNKIKSISKKHVTISRFISQVVFFILSPGLFSSAFNGVKAICTSIGQGKVISLSANITSLIVLLFFTFLFGRFFCGYACSFGAFGELVYFLADKILKKLKIKRKIKDSPHWLIYIKYVVLLLIIILALSGNQKIIQGKSPWDAFALIISGHFNISSCIIGFILLMLIILGMGCIKRFFCRFLCPLGAIFSLLPPSILLKLVKPTEQTEKYKECRGCKLCSKACPAALELNSIDIVTSGECFSCHRCIESCYQNKPRLSLFGNTSGTYIKTQSSHL